MCHARCMYACEVGYGRGRTPTLPAAEGLARCRSHREPLLLPTHRPAAHARHRGTRKGPPPPCLRAAAGTHLFPGDQLTCLPALSPACSAGRAPDPAARSQSQATLLGWGKNRQFTPSHQPSICVDDMAISLSPGDRDQQPASLCFPRLRGLWREATIDQVIFPRIGWSQSRRRR